MAFARVQGNSFNGTVGATTAPVTLAGTVGSGNGVKGGVSWANGAGITLTSVTDDKGNSYALETEKLDTAEGQKSCAFSRDNITNAPITITANFSGSAGFRKIIVDEFSGGSTASTDERDGTAHGGQYQSSPGTGTDGITSGTFTTGANGSLLYGVCFGAPATTLASNGTSFSTGTQNNTDYAGQSEYRVQATAGAGTAATFTQASNIGRMTFLIATKAPAAGGIAIPILTRQYRQRWS